MSNLNMNNIVLDYEGWTISIASHEVKTKYSSLYSIHEIAVWNPSADGEDGDIYVVDTFGNDLNGFIEALANAKDYINQKL